MKKARWKQAINMSTFIFFSAIDFAYDVTSCLSFCIDFYSMVKGNLELYTEPIDLSLVTFVYGILSEKLKVEEVSSSTVLYIIFGDKDSH